MGGAVTALCWFILAPNKSKVPPVNKFVISSTTLCFPAGMDLGDWNAAGIKHSRADIEAGQD